MYYIKKTLSGIEFTLKQNEVDKYNDSEETVDLFRWTFCVCRYLCTCQGTQPCLVHTMRMHFISDHSTGRLQIGLNP